MAKLSKVKQDRVVRDVSESPIFISGDAEKSAVLNILNRISPCVRCLVILIGISALLRNLIPSLEQRSAAQVWVKRTGTF